MPFLLPIILIVGFHFGKKLYHQPDYSKGDIAPNFIGTMPNGETFELNDLQENFILLEFWGSWCSDCRKSHPALVELYQKFHNKKYKNAKNFEIVSVGLEQREINWKNAIQRDGLIWKYHTAEFSTRGQKMFEQPLASDYGITWAPTSFLINTEGYIIKVNPSKITLEKFLTEQLQ